AGRRERAFRRPARLERLELGQGHGQRVVRHGFRLAVDEYDRERLAPVALPREEPVAELVVDLAAAFAVRLEPVDHLRLRVGDGAAVEEPAVDDPAVARVGAAWDAWRRLGRADDRQPVRARELVVALVLRGHGHDGPCAVAREHVVRDVDRNTLAVRGIDRVRAGEDAGLLLLQLRALELALARGLRAIGIDLRAPL